MPTLKKARRTHRQKVVVNPESYHRWYNCSKWVDLREYLIKNNPICALHEYRGGTALVEEVHHIKPLSYGKTDDDIRAIAYDPDNIIGLCKDCHKELHKLLKTNVSEYWELMDKIKRDGKPITPS